MKEIITTIAMGVMSLTGITPSETYIRQPDPPTCEQLLDLKDFAQCKVSEHWTTDEWSAFEAIIQKESSWTITDEHYTNQKYSTAYGLAGFLNSTWETVGCEKTLDEREQVRCAIKYIDSRYGNPTKALAFHQTENWY